MSTGKRDRRAAKIAVCRERQDHRENQAGTELLVPQGTQACPDSQADHPQSARASNDHPADPAPKDNQETPAPTAIKDPQAHQVSQVRRATGEIQVAQDLRDPLEAKDRPEAQDPRDNREDQPKPSQEHQDPPADQEPQVHRALEENQASQAHRDWAVFRDPPDRQATRALQESRAEMATTGTADHRAEPENGASVRPIAVGTEVSSSRTAPSENRRSPGQRQFDRLFRPPDCTALLFLLSSALSICRVKIV